MSDTLVVLLEDQVAGTLERVGHGTLRFAYDDTYRRAPDATPLSLSMPLEVPQHGDAAITPWLWGLLPDNEQVLTRWSRPFQVSPSSPPGTLRELGLDGDALTARAIDLAKAAPEAFADAAAAPDVAELGRPLPNRLTELVAERATRCAALLE